MTLPCSSKNRNAARPGTDMRSPLALPLGELARRNAVTERVWGLFFRKRTFTADD